jgi:hypothetical protein
MSFDLAVYMTSAIVPVYCERAVKRARVNPDSNPKGVQLVDVEVDVCNSTFGIGLNDGRSLSAQKGSHPFALTSDGINTVCSLAHQVPKTKHLRFLTS